MSISECSNGSRASVLEWLDILRKMQRAPATLHAYRTNLDDFLAFAATRGFSIRSASRQHVAEYVADLAGRPRPRSRRRVTGFANTTIQQRLTSIRLFFDYLVEEGQRETNPVARGRYRAGVVGGRTAGLLPRHEALPWLPSDDEWANLLAVASDEPLRNRLMFTFAYDCGLRREELCRLEIRDVDFAHRLLSIRAETTKTRRARTVPFSAAAGGLLPPFLSERRRQRIMNGPLFLSLSSRNRSTPITVHTWTKAVESIAGRAGVSRFTTHTFRHMCLTDLARAGWSLVDIAAFAGHRSTDSTLIYIHLSGQHLAAQYARTVNAIHGRRVALLGELFA